MKVLVIGDVNADLVLHDPDPVPRFDQVERLVSDAKLTVGGSAAITACGLARLGADVELAGVIGTDALGNLVQALLHERGVATEAIVKDVTLPTGISVVLSGPADRAILTSSGSIAELRARMIPHHLLLAVDHVHVSSYYLLDRLRDELPELLEAARTARASVSLDTNHDPSEQWAGVTGALSQVDMFLPNEQELRAIGRARSTDLAASELLDKVPTVVVKQGAAGASVYPRDGQIIRARGGAVDVVDTTGAGDSFNAGFLFGWLSGWSLRGALELGLACGGLSTMALGGVDAQPTLQQATEFVR
ncbi:PfkB family carbohydrate kinase [soil metagenome]